MDLRHILDKHWRLALVAITLIISFFILYGWRTVLLPFIVGLVIVYLLHPIVIRVEKLLSIRYLKKFKNVTAILIVFVLFGLVLGLLAWVFVTSIISSFSNLIQNGPTLFSGITDYIDHLTKDIISNFPVQLQTQVQDFITSAGQNVYDSVQGFMSNILSYIPAGIGVIFGFAILPVFVFYILKDGDKLGKCFYTNLPQGFAKHSKNLSLIVEEVLGRYLRAQLLLGFVIFTGVYIGLLLLGVPFAPVLALIAGLSELVPTVGPWIGGAIVALITLGAASEKVIPVILLMLGVQLLENTLLVPRIQGAAMKMNPALIIFLIVIGGYLAGPWGVIFAVPLTATIVKIYSYIRRQACIEDHDSDK